MSVDPLADKYPGINPYAYTLNNPVRLVDPDGKGPKGGPGNPFGPIGYTQILEGFRQTFQAIGSEIDKAYVSLTTSTEKIFSEIKFKLGVVEVKQKNSIVTSNTSEVGTNFKECLNYSGNNEVTVSPFKAENTTSFSLNSTIEVKGNVRGVDVKAINTSKIDLLDGEKSNVSEGVIGIGGNGLYIRDKTTVKSSKTDVGVKLSAEVKGVKFTLRAGVKVD